MSEPTLNLTSQPLDASSLAKFIAKFTGKRMSESEVKAMQKRLDDASALATAQERGLSRQAGATRS